nr:uncharacterized protein LOC128704112 [Cherax quadricarinatus]
MAKNSKNVDIQQPLEMSDELGLNFLFSEAIQSRLTGDKVLPVRADLARKCNKEEFLIALKDDKSLTNKDKEEQPTRTLLLVSDEQDPETENGEADIPSFLNSLLQTPEAETTTLTTPTGDDGHDLPDTRKRYAATTTPIPSPRTIWGTELHQAKETVPGKPFTDVFETEQEEVLLDDEHVPPQISLALLTTIQSKENFERLERILSLQTSFVEAQRKLKRENFERESLLYEREVLRKKRESSNMYTIPSFDLSKAASLMPKFTEDNLDSFFEAFENQAKVMQWPPKYWAALIHSSLIGKAQTITANLPFEQYSDYTQVKDCLLKAYDLLPVSYLKMFRTLKKYPQQSWVDFAREKLSAFER